MLHIRSFRNGDLSALLEIWKASQNVPSRKRLIPLDSYVLQMQVLGLPFFDSQLLRIAFEEEKPLGYVHACFAPSSCGTRLDDTAAQVCFLGVNPETPHAEEVAFSLLESLESCLQARNTHTILGGSPHPSAPFYTGLYGGAESVAFFKRDKAVHRAFLRRGFQAGKNTLRFHCDLRHFTPRNEFLQSPPFPNLHFVTVTPKAENWWRACSLANFDWLEMNAFDGETGEPCVKALLRIADPGTTQAHLAYEGIWDAALIDYVIAPKFARTELGTYFLDTLLRYILEEKG